MSLIWIRPRSILSSTFDLVGDEGGPIGTLKMGHFGRPSVIDAGATTVTVEWGGFGHWRIVDPVGSDGTVERLGLTRHRIEWGGRAVTSEPVMFGTRADLFEHSEVIGSVRPAGFLSSTFRADVPEGLPPVVTAVAGWLAIRRRRRGAAGN